jgi:phosphoglycolate phosphatase-like HAD superfamily hydrolase
LSQPKVVLFDVDGTLVDCGGAGKRSMEAAFERLYAVRDAFAELTFGGMTDRAIVRHGLEALGREATDEAMTQLLALYVEILRETLPRSPRFRVLEGAAGAAAHARATGAAVGLGTGNVREGAEIKLRCARLTELFDFGGYGCDAEARDELLRRGHERGAARLGKDASACEVVVVGDTPRDVQAARTIGARCLAVTTGRFDRDALADADLVVDSLADAEALAFLER